MKAIITRRKLLALLSGMALVAVVAATSISLSQRQPQARAASSRHAPSVSYQVSVTASATPGDATSHAASAGASAGRATPTQPPARHPGGAIAWPVQGDYASVMGSYAVNTSNTLPLTPQIEMRNIGTTTWLGDWSYYLGCVSNCMNGNEAPASGQTLGQTLTFSLQLFPPATLTTATYYSQWAMFHSPSPGVSGVQFGEIATVKISVTNAIPLGVDPAPGCDSSDMTWMVTGGACVNGATALTTNATQEPTVALQTAPPSFDSANYMITIHADFTSAPGAWVRLVSYTSTSYCNGQGVDVRSDGAYRNVLVWNCVVSDGGNNWTATPPGPSPIEVTLGFHNSGFTFLVNGQYIEDGGAIYGAYPVISAGGTDGSVVAVTNAELDTPVSFQAQWSVLQNGQPRM